MEKSLDEILLKSKATLDRSPQAVEPKRVQEPEPAEEIKLPVWEFSSDLVNTFMLNGKPISLPYRTQNPFIASMLQREYVFAGILKVESLPPEPIKYLSVRKGLV